MNRVQLISSTNIEEFNKELNTFITQGYKITHFHSCTNRYAINSKQNCIYSVILERDGPEYDDLDKYISQ